VNDTAPSTSQSGDRDLLRWAILMQLATLVVLVWIAIQLNGLPERTAQEVPSIDNSGEIFQLQNSLDQLSQKVDALQSAFPASGSPAP